MQICIYTYTGTLIHIYIYIYTYIVYTPTALAIYIYICMCLYVSVRMFTCTHIYIYTYVYIYIYGCMATCIQLNNAWSTISCLLLLVSPCFGEHVCQCMIDATAARDQFQFVFRVLSDIVPTTVTITLFPACATCHVHSPCRLSAGKSTW